jgi:hypothetical protein
LVQAFNSQYFTTLATHIRHSPSHRVDQKMKVQPVILAIAATSLASPLVSTLDELLESRQGKCTPNTQFCFETPISDLWFMCDNNGQPKVRAPPKPGSANVSLSS